MKHTTILFLVLIIFSACQQAQDEPEILQFDQPFIFTFSCEDTSSSHLELKAWLVDKYHIGSCFGMPAVDFTSYQDAYGQYPNVAAFVKNRYGLSDTVAIARIMRQLCAIQITDTEQGYLFNFTDGKCCTITTYEGILYRHGDEIEEHVTYQDSQNVPC